MDFLYHFAQTSPRLMPIYAFLFGLIMIDYSIILLGIFSFINIIINLIIKGLFKKFYGYLKVKRLPILGLGERPSGICNNNIDYGYFNKYSNIKEAKMFGMPSGHSQSAWFVFTFLVLYLYDKYINYAMIINDQIEIVDALGNIKDFDNTDLGCLSILYQS